MSDAGSDRLGGAARYSELLLGLRGECPLCSGPESSTGRLLYREEGGIRWYVELRCTDCGSCGGTWKREWLPLIEEALEAEGET